MLIYDTSFCVLEEELKSQFTNLQASLPHLHPFPTCSILINLKNVFLLLKEVPEKKADA